MAQEKAVSSAAKKKHEHEVNKNSHYERVAMRQMLRDSRIIPANAPNEKADRWLDSHGYLTHAGYKPPPDRVQRLAQRIGRRKSGSTYSILPRRKK